MIQFIALLVLVASCLSSQDTVRYVRPDNSSSSSCPGQPCLTLDQYASQQTKYFTAGTTFLFLAGNHSISKRILLNNISGVALKAVDYYSNIALSIKITPALELVDSVNFTIQGITVMFHMVNNTFQPAIVIVRSKEVFITNSTFLGNFTVAFTQSIHCNHSEIVVTRCKFKQNANTFGGAVCAEQSDLTMNGNIFEGNIGYYGGAVAVWESNLTIQGNLFIKNVANYVCGAVYVNNGNVSVKENTFERNTAEFGGAMCFLEGNLSIVGNIFNRNRAHQSSGAIYVVTSNLTMERNIYTENSALEGGAIFANRSYLILSGNAFRKNSVQQNGGAICLCCHSSLILTDRVGGTFLQNFADNFGGAVFSHESSIFIESDVADSTTSEVAGNCLAELVGGVVSFCNSSVYFQENNSGIGGAVYLSYSTFSSDTKHLYFLENVAIRGGAVFSKVSNLSLLAVNLTKNEGVVNGGAIAVIQTNASFHEFSATENDSGMLYAFLSNVKFSGDVTISRNYGAIDSIKSSVYFTGSTVFEGNVAFYGGANCIYTMSTISFSGTVLFKDNRADYDGGAIHTDATATVIMGGNVSFIANRAGKSGGAVYFENGAKLFIKQHLSLTLTSNHAAEYGGALFHRDSPSPDQCANNVIPADEYNLPCFLHFWKQTSFENFPYEISAKDNSANKDGSFLFGGLLDKCEVVIATAMNARKFYPIFLNITDVQSDTALAPAISSEAYQLCFCESDEVYSCTDEKIVKTYRGMEFSVFLIALAQGDTVTSSPVRAILSSTARLLPDQRSQNLQRNCTSLTFNMYSSQEQENLALYLDGSPCLNTGLSQAVINVAFLPCPDGFTLSGDQCVCEERLQKYHANCTICVNGYCIVKMAGSMLWVSAENSSNGTYQGLILYPTCPTQYCKAKSVNITFFDPDGQCAHNRSGLLCGACAANYSLTFGSSTCETCSNTHLALLLVFAAAGIVLVVFLTLLRLTVATGMINSVILYANIIQTNRDLFPNSSSAFRVFIAWINLDLGFQVCFYDGMDAYAQTWLQFVFPIYVWILMSLIILASRYSTTVTKIIGSNPIAVLATLLLMSYTKLLKIVIEVYSSVDLEYPGNKTVTVWLKDANDPYLQSRHLVLTVVTTLLLVFLFLPYTLLLLLGYKLYCFTGRKHTRWLMRIKPLLDAYYAPYKMHTRYWTGFLLLVRCALYIVFSYNSLGRTTQSLLAIIIAFAAIIVWLSVRIYSKLLVNTIEAVIYLNLIALSAAAQAEVDSPVLVDSLVGMVFFVMMGIIIYHFHVFYIAKSALWLKLRAKMTALRAKPTEATPLLAPVASAALPREAPAAPPQREPTRSVVSIPK